MEKFKLSDNRTNSYIESLTNKIFCILPLYEEQGLSESLVSRLDNIIMTVDGFLLLIDCDDNTSTDILSLLSKIKKAKNHAEVRSSVLRICSTLSNLKVG